MLIAERLRAKSRYEYLIYLWYVEDVLRAYSLDWPRIEQEYLPRILATASSDEQRQAVHRWYADLCEMMRSEGCATSGHIQIVKNIESELTELHTQLLQHPDRFPDYHRSYQDILPALAELRQRNTQQELTDVEMMLEALYGVMILTLQSKSVSPATKDSVERFGRQLSLLSDYYNKDKEEPLDL